MRSLYVKPEIVVVHVGAHYMLSGSGSKRVLFTNRKIDISDGDIDEGDAGDAASREGTIWEEE